MWKILSGGNFTLILLTRDHLNWMFNEGKLEGSNDTAYCETLNCCAMHNLGKFILNICKTLLPLLLLESVTHVLV
jgi:hypothetical protein